MGMGKQGLIETVKFYSKVKLVREKVGEFKINN